MLLSVRALAENMWLKLGAGDLTCQKIFIWYEWTEALSKSNKCTERSQMKVYYWAQHTVIKWDPFGNGEVKMCSNRSCLWLLSGLCYLQHLDSISLEALCLGIFCLFFFPSGRTSCLLQSKLRWTECASYPASPLGETNCSLQLCFIFIEALWHIRLFCMLQIFWRLIDLKGWVAGEVQRETKLYLWELTRS